MRQDVPRWHLLAGAELGDQVFKLRHNAATEIRTAFALEAALLTQIELKYDVLLFADDLSPHER